MCEVLGPCGVLLPMGTVHSNNDEYEYIRIYIYIRISWLIVFLHMYSLLDIIKDLEIIYSIH